MQEIRQYPQKINNWLFDNYRQWLPILIMLGVLFLSIFIAVWANQSRKQLILILLCGLIGIYLFLREPKIGFFMILIGAMFIPYSGPAGLNVVIVIVAAMLGLWILDMLIVQRRIAIVESRPVKVLLVLMVISIAAFLMGQIKWFSFANQAPIEAQLGGFAIVLLSGGAFLLVAHLIRDLKWLKYLTWTFIILGAFYILGRSLSLPLAESLYMNSFTAGSMFWTWFAALTFAQVLINRKLEIRWRAILAVVLIATIYAAYVQGGDWKSGWIPPLIAVAAILGSRYPKVAFFCAPIAIIGAYFLFSGAIASEEYSWGTRVDAWLIVVEITKVNPLLGLGFANYYWYTPLFPIRGWQVNFNSHSQYVDIFAQMGIIGLLAFTWFLAELGRLGWQLRNKVEDGFAQAYVYGTLGGLAGTILAAGMVDWVLPFVYNVGLRGFRASILAWIFLGGLVSIQQILKHDSENRVTSNGTV